jgi:MFS family permease
VAESTAGPASGLDASADVDKIVRRNAIVLTVATAFGGSLMPIAVALAGLAGSYLLASDKSLATVPVTALTVGSALATLPAAALMAKIGRRFGFMAGSLPAMIGGIVTCFAILQNSFVLFTFGCLLVGCSAAFVQQYRFAAVDGGSEVVRGKALGLVMGGGVLAAIVGPQTAIFTRDWFAPIPFAGAFLAIAALSLGNALVTSRLVDLQPAKGPVTEVPAEARSLREIARQPRFVAAVLCAMSSYALMSLVMTAAPLAMVGCGLTQDDAALGIQWHVLAMFAPSFFTGRLIARFGKDRIVIAGMALLSACAVVSMTGLSLAHFWGALVLLGIGWNFGFMGATAMLTETYLPQEKGKVQGLNDFLVFSTSALSSLAAGLLINGPGWSFINSIVFPVAILCLAALAWTTLIGSRRAR